MSYKIFRLKFVIFLQGVKGYNNYKVLFTAKHAKTCVEPVEITQRIN